MLILGKEWTEALLYFILFYSKAKKKDIIITSAIKKYEIGLIN